VTDLGEVGFAGLPLLGNVHENGKLHTSMRIAFFWKIESRLRSTLDGYTFVLPIAVTARSLVPGSRLRCGYRVFLSACSDCALSSFAV